ncbi:MAG: AmmeMemoRadiSam system protein B [Candidatus Gastranaerophilales bacterium]|nr:AmmeMemoRadiSam system protein B [Candidatus Gastranaerophilales bacterium]
MNVKQTSVDGQFYSADKEQLATNIESYLVNTVKECQYFSRAIIVPHAGHEYSGRIAAKGFQYLKKDLETLFVFAPAHRYAVDRFAISTYEEFATPLGNIQVNRDFTKELLKFGGEFVDKAFLFEHSIEVQLPFIKRFMPEAKIVPILIGGENYKTISDIISKFWEDEKVGFVISSDLSHFRNKQEAQRIDGVTADMIENNICENMLPEQACGYIGICGLVNFAKERGFSLIRLGMTDSSEKTGQTSSVVGYGSWFLAEKDKCTFISENYAELIKNLAAVSIKSQLDNVSLTVENYPRALETKMASFVTLEIGGNLRGCIGSLVGVEPVIVDICKNARNAAFKDPRFIPLEKKEFEKLNIKVSLLSAPVPYKFSSEEELLEAMVPNVDGVIIKDIGRQAVYLPEVWYQIPDKKEFLKSLKMKAGMQPDWFSDTFEAYRFTTRIV